MWSAMRRAVTTTLFTRSVRGTRRAGVRPLVTTRALLDEVPGRADAQAVAECRGVDRQDARDGEVLDGADDGVLAGAVGGVDERPLKDGEAVDELAGVLGFALLDDGDRGGVLLLRGLRRERGQVDGLRRHGSAP